MTQQDLTTTVIGTPYGMFQVVDTRTPSRRQDHFVHLYPVGGSFKVNGKTYEGSISLVRWSGDDFYVHGGIVDLSDSARTKLQQALEVLATEYPRFTHDEKVAYLTRRALNSLTFRVDQLDHAVTEVSREYRYDDAIDLTEAEYADLKRQAIDQIRNQVNSDEFAKSFRF